MTQTLGNELVNVEYVDTQQKLNNLGVLVEYEKEEIFPATVSNIAIMYEHKSPATTITNIGVMYEVALESQRKCMLLLGVG